jgi:hypothetical protein
MREIAENLSGFFRVLADWKVGRGGNKTEEDKEDATTATG